VVAGGGVGLFVNVTCPVELLGGENTDLDTPLISAWAPNEDENEDVGVVPVELR
jgi:hypothetical protein